MSISFVLNAILIVFVLVNISHSFIPTRFQNQIKSSSTPLFKRKGNNLILSAKSPHRSKPFYGTSLGEEDEENSSVVDLSDLPSFGPDFGSSLDKSPALVLNADYTPLSFLPLSLWSWQDSLRAVLSGKATMVASYGIAIRSVSVTVEMPSVIALKQFHYPPTRPPSISRRNVYLRDGFKCQYCAQRYLPSDLSLDHVIPRSRGGKLTWLNTVTACRACNFKKGQIMPDDLSRVGMRLRTLPKIPSMYELQTKSKLYRRTKIHPHWDAFI